MAGNLLAIIFMLILLIIIEENKDEYFKYEVFNTKNNLFFIKETW